MLGNRPPLALLVGWGAAAVLLAAAGAVLLAAAGCCRGRQEQPPPHQPNRGNISRNSSGQHIFLYLKVSQQGQIVQGVWKHAIEVVLEECKDSQAYNVAEFRWDQTLEMICR